MDLLPQKHRRSSAAVVNYCFQWLAAHLVLGASDTVSRPVLKAT